nr:4781_t:CDS:2 [Entrophospora candida]
MKGTFYTITYLQRLSIEYFELILEFATWALENDPDNGMDIFIDDFPDVQNFTKKSILELRQICQECKSDNSNQAVTDDGRKNVFMSLLRIYLYPSNGEQVIIESALRLLSHVDATEKHIRESNQNRNMDAIVENLLKADQKQIYLGSLI